MNEHISIKTFLESDHATQQDAFWDWFCDDSLLPRKTEKLTKLLKNVCRASVGHFDVNKTCVCFKNNQPLFGKQYDDFRICDIEMGDVIYTIIPANGHNDDDHGNSQVYGRENKFGSLAKLVGKKRVELGF